MSTSADPSVTLLLQAAAGGDSRAAAELAEDDTGTDELDDGAAAAAAPADPNVTAGGKRSQARARIFLFTVLAWA